MKKLFYIQPYLVNYRKELVDSLKIENELTVLSDIPDSKSGFSPVIEEGFDFVHCKLKYFLGGRLYFQKGVLRTIFNRSPDAILAAASVRDISFWLALIFCWLCKVPMYAHGQGLYNKASPGVMNKCMYFVLIFFSRKYFCYTQSVKNSLVDIGINPKHLVVIENSISFDSDGEEVLKTGVENGILFIGRLRQGSNLELLIESMIKLNSINIEYELHIIGTGEEESYYRNKYSHKWIHWYGKIYDQSKIVEISKLCRLGCYPGDAGLSVVHYFSLRLPALVHDDMYSHMGPEPSYIESGLNGFTFSKSETDIGSVIKSVFNLSREDYFNVSDGAFKKYRKLNSPSFGKRMIAAIKGIDANE